MRSDPGYPQEGSAISVPSMALMEESHTCKGLV